MRVIDTHPDRKADIRGIDSHCVTIISIETARGASTTTIGEVIAIMNQHACHGKNKTIHPPLDRALQEHSIRLLH